jgi:ribosome maturation factor RimP
MGARRPFFVKEQETLAATHEKERHLTREIARRVETALPETEVLAVELTKPDGFTVYIDDVRGVDHALCERVTNLLVEYRREWDISVSSPGSERPLRTPQHFRNVVGRRVALRTKTKRRVRGEVADADDRAVTVRTQTESVDIPYEAIVRGNLIDEGIGTR